jgi:predicted transcriptional regulator
VIAAGLVVSPVFSCDEEDSAGLVMAAMSGHKINAVAVTQHGHFVGALSSHVLLHLENMEELSMPVGKLLAKHRAVIDPVLTCGPRDSVADVLKKFESGNAHRVFVVDRKNAIGVITLSSLFRCMFDAKAANRSDTMGSVNILK